MQLFSLAFQMLTFLCGMRVLPSKPPPDREGPSLDEGLTESKNDAEEGRDYHLGSPPVY